MTENPFFHPEYIIDFESNLINSLKWTTALDNISQDIKNAEANLQLHFKTLPLCHIDTKNGSFDITHNNLSIVRLMYSDKEVPSPKPVIELPIESRIRAYKEFPEFFNNLMASNKENESSRSKSKSIIEILKESFDKVKEGFLAGPAIDRLLDELKKLRQEAPGEAGDIKQKAHWIKRLAETLYGSGIMNQFILNVKTQLPQIWDNLTLTQKLKVGAIAPIAGAGAYLGSMGLASGGTAVGIPVFAVVLLLLLLSNSLFDFIDYLIKQLSLVAKKQPTPDEVSKIFEAVLNTVISNLFGRDHNPKEAKEPNTNSSETGPRAFESISVKTMAEKYNGTGYVTQYSSDGGIDGYIVCHTQKEVILVQSKLYSNKVGFGDATQYLGTYYYWKRALEHKFSYPISKMIIVCSTDFSIEAKKVAESFSDVLVLEKLEYSETNTTI